MKFTINQSDLLAALQIVYPAIKQSIIIPICETVKFEVLPDCILLTATNIQVELSTRIQGEFEEPGSFCVPATKLNYLVSNLGEQPLVFQVNNKIAAIKTSNGKYELPVTDAIGFPVFKSEPDKSILIDAGEFQAGINKTVFACSDSDKKPQQTGVFIEITEDKIQFTSTDAHRVNHIEFPTVCTLNTSIIIPATSLKLMPKFEGEIEILFGSKNIAIANATTSFKSTLIDATFPDYKAVIPANDNLLTIDKALLIGSIKRVSGFSNFATNVLKLEIKDQFTISGQNIEFSEFGEEILNSKLSEGDITIGLSAKYLSESIASIEGNDVYMLFSQAHRGVLIKEDPQSLDYILVMPMQLI